MGIVKTLVKCSICGAWTEWDDSLKVPPLCVACWDNRAGADNEVAACKRAYYEAHKDEVAAYQRAYREAHKDEVAACKRAYREAHKDEVAASQRAYREAHKDEVAACKRGGEL
jgi:hypothetical protein